MATATDEPSAACPTAEHEVQIVLTTGDVAGGSLATPLGPMRRTIALPASLVELKQCAVSYFDPSGRYARLRLFHKGREMHRPQAISDLRSGDEVLVRLERGVFGLQHAGDRFVTSHQADYVKYPLTARTPTLSDAMSTLTADLMRHKMDGQTSYTIDYTPREAGPRAERAGDAKFSQHFLVHAPEADRRSSYYHDYKGHGGPRPTKGSTRSSCLSEAAMGHTFAGRTSYTEHYSRKPNQPFQPPVKVIGNDHESVLTDVMFQQAFQGESRYTMDFVKHTTDGRQPNARPVREDLSARPFNETSEYRREYQHVPATPARVHLQLEGYP